MDPGWFSEALRAEMQRRGTHARAMSHSQLAEVLGCSKSAVTQWLSKERYPAFPDFCAVCDRLGWDLSGVVPFAFDADDAVPRTMPYADDLLELMMDALASVNPLVRHFALAVLEDESLMLDDEQAARLSARLVELSRDKRVYLASHFVLLAIRLLRQCEAVVPLLGGLLVSSTNVLVRYRVLVGFLSHPQLRESWIHFVRSAMAEGAVARDAYEMAGLRFAEGSRAKATAQGERFATLEGARTASSAASSFLLINPIAQAMEEERGVFAWYHTLDAAAASGPGGLALLMNRERELAQGGDAKDCLLRRRDLVASINRAGVNAISPCDFLFRELLAGEDHWLRFHAVAAFGKLAPRDAAVADLIAGALTDAMKAPSEELAQLASLACYALAKLRLSTQAVDASLRKAAKAKDPWLRAVARIASECVSGECGLQEGLQKMLEAA